MGRPGLFRTLWLAMKRDSPWAVTLVMNEVFTLAGPWVLYTWAAALAICCAGLFNSQHLLLGYALCYVVNGVVAGITSEYQSAIATASCVLYTAYGLRLATYLLRRNADPSFAQKREAARAKTSNTALYLRATSVAVVSFSQVIYALPLRLLSSSSTPMSGHPMCEVMGWISVLLSSGGLALSTCADEHKLAAKRAGPNLPVMDGLYSTLRHPNHLGDWLFHFGMAGLALAAASSASTTPHAGFAAVTGPVLMLLVVMRAAFNLDTEGSRRYGNSAAYLDWVAEADSLFPQPEVSRKAWSRAAKQSDWRKKRS